ncbi:hypothetical protein [Nocardia brasiliensis]|uniref:hypothetical protein n=1 Tax=Nocardia brasiliensis TaxID=37326 RepID=UPI003D8FBA68
MVTTPRRAAMAKARLSRRPSRLGLPAGSTPVPEHTDYDDGLPGLLARLWAECTRSTEHAAALELLLTLGGRVPAAVRLRALAPVEEAAVAALSGRSWRPVADGDRDADDRATVFLGEIGLTTDARIVIRTPSDPPLSSEHDLIDGVRRIPWTARAVAHHQQLLAEIDTRRTDSIRDCRQWLAGLGGRGRDESLGELTEAALRTAPFILYEGPHRYSNFREPNNLTGKSLWPGHPDCVLSSLRGLPLDLWSDSQVVLVVCLLLLVRSAGPARIEEANGTQLSIDHVADLLEEIRLRYNLLRRGPAIAAPASKSVAALLELADALRTRRAELTTAVQLYREIHGALVHKTERVAGPVAEPCEGIDRRLSARLTELLPVSGRSLAELSAAVAAHPDWLAARHGEFGSGLESLVYETVSAAVREFGADFAMSRGLRSLPRLVAALRGADWAEIVRWEIADYFCCVVPDPAARAHFGGSPVRLADIAWSMAARMQYNSWHFIAGNLPGTPVVQARDHFFPPRIPDISHFSDLHHHGHIAGHVRFTIRSPQPVRVLDRLFNGFVDLRLLRCLGPAFDEQELLAAQRVSAFIARATEQAAALVATGRQLEVTAFDTAWHWATIAGSAPEPDIEPVGAPVTLHEGHRL